MSDQGETTAIESGPPHPDWQRGLDGKWYPPSVHRTLRRPVARVLPSQRRLGPVTRLAIFVLVVGVIAGAAIIAVVAVVSNNSSSGASSHAVGTTARTGDLEITVNRTDDPFVPANAAEVPPAGTHLIAVDVTIHNVNVSQDLIVSSVTMFELTDARGGVERLEVVPSVGQIDFFF